MKKLGLFVVAVVLMSSFSFAMEGRPVHKGEKKPHNVCKEIKKEAMKSLNEMKHHMTKKGGEIVVNHGHIKKFIKTDLTEQDKTTLKSVFKKHKEAMHTLHKNFIKEVMNTKTQPTPEQLTTLKNNLKNEMNNFFANIMPYIATEKSSEFTDFSKKFIEKKMQYIESKMQRMQTLSNKREKCKK